jgi:MYXO-CTERM domain-containing protein
MLRSWVISLTAATFLVHGCDESDQVEQFIADTKSVDLRQPGLVEDTARYSDPMSMIYLVTLTTIGQFFAFEGDEARACPRLFDASDRATGIVDWRIEGDCEWQDEEGQHRMEGSIVGRGDKNGIEIEYRDLRQTTVSASQCAGQETSIAMTGVVRLPFALLPSGNEEPEEVPPSDEEPEGDKSDDEEWGVGHYDIHLLVETVEREEGSCRILKAALAHDVTINRTVETLEGADGSARGSIDIADVQGRMAVVLESRESASEPWQTEWAGAWRVSAEGYGSASGDANCEGYMTGTLRLEAGGDVALLQPSAPASCFSDEQIECTAWSLNGEAQPSLCGFAGLSKGFGCSAGPDAPPPWTAMVILLAGLIWQERRRRRA